MNDYEKPHVERASDDTVPNPRRYIDPSAEDRGGIVKSLREQLKDMRAECERLKAAAVVQSRLNLQDCERADKAEVDRDRLKAELQNSEAERIHNTGTVLDRLKLVEAEVEGLKATYGCLLAGPGRGDCEHFIGLPGRSIAGVHDGPDNTVDEYGRPNGWCEVCWSHHLVEQAEVEVERLKAELATQDQGG